MHGAVPWRSGRRRLPQLNLDNCLAWSATAESVWTRAPGRLIRDGLRGHGVSRLQGQPAQPVPERKMPGLTSLLPLPPLPPGKVSDVKRIKAKVYSCDSGTLSTRQAGKWFQDGN